MEHETAEAAIEQLLMLLEVGRVAKNLMADSLCSMELMAALLQHDKACSEHSDGHHRAAAG